MRDERERVPRGLLRLPRLLCQDIAAGAIFGFQLGTYFSVAMVALAGAALAGVRIIVQPRYVPEQSEPAESQYLFAYHITIRNEGTETVHQLVVGREVTGINAF